MVVYSDKGVVKICFQKKRKSKGKTWNDPMFRKVTRELDHYLKGRSQSPDIRIDWKNIEGTVFQKQVWKKIKQIPYGQVKTYGEVARSIENPGAFRAIGSACAKNPLLLVVPCHRVVGVKGLGGFSGGGLNIKKRLHFLEGIRL